MKKGNPLDHWGCMRIAGRYGFTSTTLAINSLVGSMTLGGVGRAGAATRDSSGGKANLALIPNIRK